MSKTIAFLRSRIAHSTAMRALSVACCYGFLFGLAASTACTPSERPTARARLALGFAVDTTVVPGAWWGVDPALAARAAVVRTWHDYLAIRADTAKRLSYWSAEERRRASDPDLVLASEGYILDADAVLVEALPAVAGDSSRWILRTVYVGEGTAAHPGLLAMERVHVVRENGRWMLSHPSSTEAEAWYRARVGLIEYVIHPALRFNAKRAADTAEWAAATALRFGIPKAAPITYYQVPDLQAAFQVMGLDWALSADRVGGRANPRARVDFAADPSYGEAYRHELVHVLLHPVVGGKSVFVSEGIAYWLGGARGKPFPEMMQDLANYLEQRPAVGLPSIFAPTNSARLPGAAAVFEIAHRRGGDDGVRRFVSALGKDEPSLDTIARALGLAPAEFDSAWRATVLSYAAKPR